MQIEINEKEYCKLAIKYQGSEDVVRITRNKIVEEMMKSYDVSGFRKGKATAEAIKFSYPKEVEENLKTALAKQAFSDVMVEKNLKPFGYPQFTSTFLFDDMFKCEFDLHIQPNFELKEYKGFDLPKYHPPMTSDELAQKLLQEVRVQHGETLPFSETDRVADGDQIILTCHALLNEQELSELSFSGTMLQVGRINIPGFSDQLLGMQLDEEKQFNLKLPDDFYKSEYAAQTVSFTVKLMMGSKVVPANLDDELAKKCGMESFDQLTQQAHTLASNRVQEWEANHLNDQIARRLLENHQELQVPAWISAPEAKIMAENAKQTWDQISDNEKNTWIKNAEQAIKISLILGKIQEEMPEAQLTQEELLELTKIHLQRAGADPDKTMEKLYKNGQLTSFFARVREEYALNAIVKNCNIIE